MLAHPRAIAALRLLFALVLLAALVLALRPATVDPWPQLWDKAKHAGAFALLAAIAAFAFREQPLTRLAERLSFLGALIEIAQAAPMIGRDCDWKDWVADTLAVVVVLVLIRLSGLRDETERSDRVDPVV